MLARASLNRFTLSRPGPIVVEESPASSMGASNYGEDFEEVRDEGGLLATLGESRERERDIHM